MARCLAAKHYDLLVIDGGGGVIMAWFGNIPAYVGVDPDVKS
jgi:hypothetical protein